MKRVTMAIQSLAIMPVMESQLVMMRAKAALRELAMKHAMGSLHATMLAATTERTVVVAAAAPPDTQVRSLWFRCAVIVSCLKYLYR